jgi:MbtH protein
MHADDDDLVTYRVVVNHEEQYSIWRSDRDLPRGWRDAGVVGRKGECLEHIERVWTDMRPLSLRAGCTRHPTKDASLRLAERLSD